MSSTSRRTSSSWRLESGRSLHCRAGLVKRLDLAGSRLPASAVPHTLFPYLYPFCGWRRWMREDNSYSSILAPSLALHSFDHQTSAPQDTHHAQHRIYRLSIKSAAY
ncbi:hypothetical protein AMAG_11195 [Allomyces macrogynus ATCC 38327]|uniref:Uncharacterized protein n=1 Tax=Allomyces macrogynus (strain ATCC 38327) TaxID=578462 RepID=A0A0L0SWH5_ALLM3|nr:hypothetical protein AMAG_11195 [Allomyces macrogynus ATCC 38327]|eukprot:KNE66694.1 hypothetical protein AMAG_11195 [Allomyces macrogynus ATCC 38327]